MIQEQKENNPSPNIRLGIVFAMILSSLFLCQRPDKVEIGLGAIAVLGSFGSAFKSDGAINWFGIALAVGSTLSFTISNLIMKHSSKNGTNGEILTMVNLISAIVLLTYCFLNLRNILIPQNINTWLLIIVGAFFGNCLGCWLYLESMKRLSFSRANLIRGTGPIFTLVVSYPFFGLNFSLPQIVSAILLLGSMIVLTSYEHYKKLRSQK